MSFAYIVLVRKDIANNGLQIVDLKPNTSLAVPSLSGSPNFTGQTGYLGNNAPVDTTLVAYTPVGGNDTMTATANGLAAYLVDHVCDADNSNIILTFARANSIAAAILGAAVAGSALTVAALNGFIRTATGGGSSTFDGAGSTKSIGVVSDLLRVLSGTVWQIPAGGVLSGASHAFVNPHTTTAGSFINATNTAFVNTQNFVNTGALHLSLAGGSLSKLIASGYIFVNPLINYAAGNAQNIDGTDVGVNGNGAAVVVYDNLGNVLTN